MFEPARSCFQGGLYDLFRDRFDGLPFSSQSRTRRSAEAIIDFSLERGVQPSMHLALSTES
jgi:hypothetical protein